MQLACTALVNKGISAAGGGAKGSCAPNAAYTLDHHAPAPLGLNHHQRSTWRVPWSPQTHEQQTCSTANRVCVSSGCIVSVQCRQGPAASLCLPTSCASIDAEYGRLINAVECCGQLDDSTVADAMYPELAGTPSSQPQPTTTSHARLTCKRWCRAHTRSQCHSAGPATPHTAS